MQRKGTDDATGWQAGATKRDGKPEQNGIGQMVQQDSRHNRMTDASGATGRLVQRKGIKMPAQRNGTDGATKWDGWCN